MSGGRAERERERERENPKQVLHCQHRACHGAQIHKTWDHDLSRNQELDTTNWATQVPPTYSYSRKGKERKGKERKGKERKKKKANSCISNLYSKGKRKQKKDNVTSSDEKSLAGDQVCEPSSIIMTSWDWSEVEVAGKATFLGSGSPVLHMSHCLYKMLRLLPNFIP